MIASMPMNTARALLRIAADRDTRKYLNGFWIEPSGIAVASDGSCMLAVSGVLVDFQGPPVFIERTALESFLKAAGKTPYDLVVTRDALRAGPVAVTYHAPESGDASGLQLFPWRRVVPHEVTGAADYETKPAHVDGPKGRRWDCLDSRIVERMRVALGELSGKTPAKAGWAAYLMNSNGAAVFSTVDSVLAVVMPMRTDATPAALTAHCATWAASSDAPVRTLKAADEVPA
jgi:hypothetical protein